MAAQNQVPPPLVKERAAGETREAVPLPFLPSVPPQPGLNFMYSGCRAVTPLPMCKPEFQTYPPPRLWPAPCLAKKGTPCLWMGMWYLVRTVGSEVHFPAPAGDYDPCSISRFGKPKHPLSWDLARLYLACWERRCLRDV